MRIFYGLCFMCLCSGKEYSSGAAKKVAFISSGNWRCALSFNVRCVFKFPCLLRLLISYLTGILGYQRQQCAHMKIAQRDQDPTSGGTQCVVTVYYQLVALCTLTAKTVVDGIRRHAFGKVACNNCCRARKLMKFKREYRNLTVLKFKYQNWEWF